ncbi:MAG: hypothetical protein E6Q53_01855 [Candidatus Moraniibacteriota bacterium]|nr:MAG: hypothetical protein E6Q53_01855 [Candidatus Moranbacteria bacterium]
MKKLLIALLLSLLPFTFYLKPVSAAVCGDNVPSEEGELKSYVDDCNAKLKSLSGQKATLAQALGVLTTQINLTQAKIAKETSELNKLEIEISDLSGKIQSLDYSLTDLTKLFVARVKSSYMSATNSPISLLLHVSGITELTKGIQYVEKVRDHDQKLLLSLEKSRLDFDQQRSMKEQKQAEIETVKKVLDREKAALATQVAAKNKLLVDTKNDEVRFQSLLSQATAQLAAFRRFASNQGGASIVSNQTKCDSWGCYYNQRDSQWGNQTIGLSNETMKEVGCLVTSMAMVASHYGKSIKPGDIAASSSPFWSNTAYMNQGTWSAAGVTMTRTRIGSSTAKIDEELAAGRPVVVGIYGGPNHFLVSTKKEGYYYIMNDPFPENGGGIKFTSKYPLSAITAVDRVSVN